jgi:hypothetical protein
MFGLHKVEMQTAKTTDAGVMKIPIKFTIFPSYHLTFQLVDKNNMAHVFKETNSIQLN